MCWWTSAGSRSADSSEQHHQDSSTRARAGSPARRAEQAPALAFVTLGCPKNTVDSENMLGLLVRDGFRTVADPAEADVAVVNTCAFLSERGARIEASHRARRRSCKRAGSLRGLIVTGCLAQRAGEALLAEFPEVDAVLGTGQWREVVSAARHVLAGKQRTLRAHRVSGRRARRAVAARALDAAASGVPQDLRGLRSSLHVLHHPAAARRSAEPADRGPGGGGRAPGRAGRARTQSDRPGHHRLRHRPAGAPHARRSARRRSTRSRG